MLNLELNTLTDELDGIIIRPYQFSYEELIDIINECDDEIILNEFTNFCNDFIRGCDVFINAMVVNDYVDQHGVDEAVTALIGNEGLISGIKNAFVTFAKWLWDKLKKLFDFIVSLFRRTKSIATNNPKSPENITNNLMGNNPSVRKQTINNLKKESETKTESVPRIKDIKFTIETHMKSIRDATDNVKNIGRLYNTIANDAFAKMDDTSQLDKFNSDLSSAFESFKSSISGNEILDRFKVTINLDDFTENLYMLRAAAMSISTEIKKIPKIDIKDDESAYQFLMYAAKAFDLNLKGSVDDFRREDASFKKHIVNYMKLAVAGARSMVVVAYKCDRMTTPKIVSIVTQLTDHISNYDENSSHTDAYADGGVDVRVPIPSGLMKRMRDAWKDPSLTIKRLIVTNSRSTGVMNSASRICGFSQTIYLASKLGLVREVVINYSFFKNKLRFQNFIKEYKDDLAHHNINPKSNDIDVSEDQVESFLRTLVHECRHVYQKKNNVARTDAGKDSSKFEDYLKLEHERDARKAAMNFKFDSEDVVWVKNLIARCIKQECANIKKEFKNELKQS